MYLSEELCHPNPCGPNTVCEARNSIIACSCQTGYHGTPAYGCRHECENDYECPDHLACRQHKCTSVCSDCGVNAECTGVRNHHALCHCPKVKNFNTKKEQAKTRITNEFLAGLLW